MAVLRCNKKQLCMVGAFNLHMVPVVFPYLSPTALLLSRRIYYKLSSGILQQLFY